MTTSQCRKRWPLSRRRFMQASAAGLAATAWPRCVRAADVSWLAELQRPPDAPVTTDRPLSPLLESDDGAAISTVEHWEARRRRIHADWLEFLGPMPAEKPDLACEVLSEEVVENVRRQRIRYATEQGVPAEGYLLKPTGGNGARRRAAVVALHSTTDDNIEEIAGLTGRPSRQLGWALAQRGLVVFCPRCFLWQEADDYRLAVERFRRRHPHTLGMHKILWDARRAVDLLTSLTDDVDPQRIGAVGHSLGAKEAMYLIAFDQRVKAAVASEGGVGFRFTNWDAPWYLGPTIHDERFAINHHQLLALAAPRPLLILAGESGPGAADGDRTWPYVAAAAEVYRLYGEPIRLALYNHRQGHSIPPLVHERLCQWLECYLHVAER